jgi:hypothetical protein
LLIWTSETQVMAKRRVESQIDNLIPDQKKSGINPIYLAVEGVRHTFGKLSTRTTTLFLTALQSDVCLQSYRVPKSWESHLAQFWDSHSGVLGEKNHLDVGSVASHREYYKGEGGGFPQVQVVVNLACPMAHPSTKVAKLCTNHFVWVVCKPMWVSEACQLFLVPSRNSNTPLYPSKCCELGSVPRFLPLSLFSTWIHIWVFQGVGSVSLGLFPFLFTTELFSWGLLFSEHVNVNVNKWTRSNF